MRGYPVPANTQPELDEAEGGGDVPPHHLILDLGQFHLGEIGRGIQIGGARAGSLAPLLPLLVLLVIDDVVEVIGNVNPALPGLGDEWQDEKDKEVEGGGGD